MDSKTPLILLLILLKILSNSFLCSSLSTFSISETSNQTLICSLIPSQYPSQQQQPFLNCTNFPIGSQGIQIPPISPNISISGIVSGNGFLCLLIRVVPISSSSVSTLNCWRFSSSSSGYGTTGFVTTSKRIYRGQVLGELEAGDSHICARVNSTNRIECWQWPRINTTVPYNISGISVGGDFLCGIAELQQIKCFGTDTDIVGREPAGNYSVVSAGFRHSCAISTDGKINCWGNIARGDVVLDGEFKFKSLASGNNRSCGILRDNGTVVCWGENDFELPKILQGVEFLKIEAKNQVFCGIGTRYYSLFCWGNEIFNENHMVFRRVQPGPCSTSCPCILPNSGVFCSRGEYICLPCPKSSPALPPSSPVPPPSLPPPPPDPPKPSTSPPKPSTSSTDKKIVAFLVVGSVGTFSLAIISFFFLFKFCKGKACRIHDSGPLAQGTVQAAQIGSNREQIPQMRPEPEPEPVLTDNRRLSQMVSMGSNLEEFSWEVLIQATDSFSTAHKIGQGSFGTVYRAILDDGREVAIKRADFATNKHQEEKETAFISELSHLSRLNHKNLVRLFGYCDERNERLLVYEFMINGTLHDHLHKLDNSPIDSWITRLKIAVDAARGIEYLHTYAVPSIIHRDIKSSNILLDATFTAKVSDFGLSLLGPKENESHLSLRAAGTLGYMDPEYYRSQKLTSKSDVYSYGVLLLELLSGYKAIHPNEHGTPRNVVDYAMPFILNDNIHRLLDAKVPPPTPFEIEAVTYVGYLAADCVNLEGKNRPSMTEVVTSLEKALAACEMPLILSRSTTRSSA